MLFQAEDIEDLSVGSAILGSGGGGNPTCAKWMLRHQIQRYGPIEIRSLDTLSEKDWVAPLGLMGAPLVCMEKMLTEHELESVLDAIQERTGRCLTALMVGEIGGANAFTPLLIAGKRGLPVLDADLLGRAFPKLEMNSASLHGLPVAPIWIADALGNSVYIQGDDPKRLEEIARHVAVSFGSSCAFSFAVGDGRYVQRHAIAGTLSYALELGRAVRGAQDPFKALEALGGRFLACGIISDIDSTVQNGFLQGRASITAQDGSGMHLLYQNEYLFAQQGSRCLGATPDLLVLLDENSGLPIMSETLRFGLQVRLFLFPSPPVWKSPQGLELVGPKAFDCLSKEDVCAI